MSPARNKKNKKSSRADKTNAPETEASSAGPSSAVIESPSISDTALQGTVSTSSVAEDTQSGTPSAADNSFAKQESQPFFWNPNEGLSDEEKAWCVSIKCRLGDWLNKVGGPEADISFNNLAWILQAPIHQGRENTFYTAILKHVFQQYSCNLHPDEKPVFPGKRNRFTAILDLLVVLSTEEKCQGLGLRFFLVDYQINEVAAEFCRSAAFPSLVKIKDLPKQLKEVKKYERFHLFAIGLHRKRLLTDFVPARTAMDTFLQDKTYFGSATAEDATFSIACLWLINIEDLKILYEVNGSDNWKRLWVKVSGKTIAALQDHNESQTAESLRLASGGKEALDRLAKVDNHLALNDVNRQFFTLQELAAKKGAVSATDYGSMSSR